MAIEHRNIPEADLHEPKGVSIASANRVYVSNGSGSGAWDRLKAPLLQGLSGDGGSANMQLQSDGANGFQFRATGFHGANKITNNGNAFALTAAGDATLNTASQYVLLTGTGAPWNDPAVSYGIAPISNGLQVATKGLYKLDLVASIASFPSSSAFVGLKYRVNGTSFSTSKFSSGGSTGSNAGQIVGFDLVNLNPGDLVQIYIASTVTGNIVIADMVVALTLVRAT